MKITLNYITLKHMAEHVHGGLSIYGTSENAILKALKDYFVEFDVEGIERDERPEKRDLAPFEVAA